MAVALAGITSVLMEVHAFISVGLAEYEYWALVGKDNCESKSALQFAVNKAVVFDKTAQKLKTSGDWKRVRHLKTAES